MGDEDRAASGLDAGSEGHQITAFQFLDRPLVHRETDMGIGVAAVAREVRHLDVDTRTMLFQALKELASLSLKTLKEKDI